MGSVCTYDHNLSGDDLVDSPVIEHQKDYGAFDQTAQKLQKSRGIDRAFIF